MSAPRSALTRLTGTVEWFNDVTGIGRIARDDGLRGCVADRSSFRGGEVAGLTAGDRIEFEVVEHEHGPWAERVTLLARPVP